MITFGLQLLLGVLVLVGASLSCGGAVCRNGEAESGEECDDGNDRDDDACSNQCRIKDTLDATIKWTLVANAVPGFNESCLQVDADQIHLVLSGPMEVEQTVACSSAQYPFRALKPGRYTVRATLLRDDPFGGMAVPMTRDNTMATFDMAKADVEVDLDFAYAAFLDTYDGSFFYRIKWNGSSTCAGANPPVVMQTLGLSRDGVPIAGMTSGGLPLDGSIPAACDGNDPAHPSSIDDLIWGEAEITLVGFDAMGEPRYRGTYPTFVGASISNPDQVFDVELLAAVSP